MIETEGSGFFAKFVFEIENNRFFAATAYMQGTLPVIQKNSVLRLNDCFERQIFVI